MMTVLAAVDDSPATEPVLQTSVRLAQRLSTRVRAMHVGRDSPPAIAREARRAGVELVTVPGIAAEVICEAIEAEDVQMGVMGIRGREEGRRPAGRIATEVCGRSRKPVVVVPPSLEWREGEQINRALVPLDGTDESSRSVQGAWELLKGSGVELVALHVFSPGSAPRFWDATRDDVDAWSQEFLLRHAEPEAQLEIRTGEAAQQMLDVGRDSKCDLLVLAWSQELARGRAAVVHEVLSSTETPVLLLPVQRS